MIKKGFNVGWFVIVICLLQACSKQSVDKPLSGKNFSLFEFKIAQNILLAQDITCDIQGDTIFATAFSGTDLTGLKAAFSFEGAEVTVSGQVQSSGQTNLNFSTPVTYTIKALDGTTRQFTVKFVDTNIPTAYISTNNVAVESKDNYIAGYMKIKGRLSGDSLFSGAMEIRGRGNSTWQMPKKPYKIKLNKKAGLLSMNESKQWILLANYADKSLLRNETAFELSRRLALAYTPAGKFVDVILNGSYIGNYELVEQIDVGKNKVNITEQDAATTTLPGISGGYLVEVDGFARDEAVNFNTSHNMLVSVHYPGDEDINETQRNYIGSWFNGFESSLFAANFDDPLNGYKRYFDISSYVNFYLVNEIMGNPDIFWSSYMYKNRNNDTIYTGPVWDFDVAANNDERLGDAVNKLMLDAAHEPKQWINRLMEDKAFRNKVQYRWNQIKVTQLGSLTTFIDELSARLAASQKKNFTRWPILGEKVYRNLQAAGSYPGEVNYLKNYLSNRIAWLDTQFNGARFD
ncbi:MAG: CotH kinase family protein [Ferruginibacter sp.]